MPREFLFFTKESVPGTFDVAAAAGDKGVIRLDRANAFNPSLKPITWVMRDAGGSNRPVWTGNEQMEATATLSTPMYYTQANVLLPWACNITGDPFDTSSLTLDHVIMKEDASHTQLYRRYLGCKCASMKLAASNSGDGVLVRLDFSLLYTSMDDTIDATDRPTPTLDLYPNVKPAVFQDLAGNLTLGGARTSFSSCEINVNNILQPQYDESRYPQELRWSGRDISSSIRFRYKSDADRTAMEAATATTMEVSFESGAYGVLFDMHDANRIMTVDEDRPLDNAFQQTIGTMGYIDLVTDLTDMTVTVTQP